MALTVFEKQMQIDAVHVIAFGRQIAQRSNQEVRFSLEDLSELVIARIVWTKAFSKFIHFKAELGSKGNLIMIDGVSMTIKENIKMKKRAKTDYYG